VETETPTPQETIEAERQEEAQNFKREVIDFVKLVIWFLVIFLSIKFFVLEGYEVQGESMEPNLASNERIIVFKFPHRLSQLGLFGKFEPFEQGDVIVFDSPDADEKRYVKRVIAVGPRPSSGTVEAGTNSGDTVHVEFELGKVYVDNHILTEDYLSENNRTSYDVRKLDLNAGEYYVLGDNRSVSKDSRSFNAIEDEAIIGRAIFRFWPPSKISIIR
jgi:signal peptidase I